ncbi:MAG TPA: hypothetical protein VFT37_10040 [Telluria sp.]|nr:hypothetical protein [Telluria sp.]
MAIHWDVHEVSLRELGAHTYESITERYRRAQPVCLVTPLEHLEGQVALNLFAPKDAAFWNAPMHRTTRACRDAAAHLYDAPEARQQLMRDLRQAKMRMASPQIRLLGQYVDVVGASKRAIESLSIERSYAESWRFWPIGAHASKVDAVIARLDREAGQFGERAFFGIDESVVLADPTGMSSLGCQLFQGAGHSWRYSQAERDRHERDILDGLKRETSRFGHGLPFQEPVEPVWMIKGCVSLWFPNWGEPPENEADEVFLQVRLQRARLVRMLGWPHQFESVQNDLRQIEQAQEARSATCPDPYGEILAEMRQYLADMRRRYPIFDEPFSLV